jgi:hypothetical protein
LNGDPRTVSAIVPFFRGQEMGCEIKPWRRPFSASGHFAMSVLGEDLGEASDNNVLIKECSYVQSGAQSFPLPHVNPPLSQNGPVN